MVWAVTEDQSRITTEMQLAEDSVLRDLASGGRRRTTPRVVQKARKKESQIYYEAGDFKL
jgi:hypothetical protein